MFGSECLLPGFSPGPPGKLPRVVVWFRRDLRLEDNPALTAALKIADEVIPVYIYAPEEEGQFQPGRCSRWWLSSSLRSLDADLRALGSRLLCFRATESRVALSSLVRDLGAQGVLFNHLYDPISLVRDNEIKAAMALLGVMCSSFNGDVLREPWEVVQPTTGQPYSSFNEFWKAHKTLSGGAATTCPLPVPQALPAIPLGLENAGTWDLGIMTPEEEMSNSQLEFHWTPGCDNAHRLLNAFINDRLVRFSHDRAKTDRDSTSRVSPHIHFGEISVRSICAAATLRGKGLNTDVGTAATEDFLRQVGYREYSRYLSFHFPFTHERALLEHLRVVPWRLDQTLFKAWRTGTTGFPLIDAAMRELWSTGWSHNRMRVVCASFLVKDLLLPWQWGLKHYWDALLDADLECDALGWQYCAGCLVDAHPFSYRMDLDTETKKFDPDGNFVRRWMPVLSRLPRQYIHAPWKAPPDVLADAGVELGVNYPWPIVDLDASREALETVAALIETAATTIKNGSSVGGGGGAVGAGGGGGALKRNAAAAAAAVDAAIDDVNANAADDDVNNNANGPFRPPTLPDPFAANRVWGAGGSGGVGVGVIGHAAGASWALAEQQYRGNDNVHGGGDNRERNLMISMRSGDDDNNDDDGDVSEEVQSNAVLGDDDVGSCMFIVPQQEEEVQAHGTTGCVGADGVVAMENVAAQVGRAAVAAGAGEQKTSPAACDDCTVPQIQPEKMQIKSNTPGGDSSQQQGATTDTNNNGNSSGGCAAAGTGSGSGRASQTNAATTAAPSGTPSGSAAAQGRPPRPKDQAAVNAATCTDTAGGKSSTGGVLPQQQHAWPPQSSKRQRPEHGHSYGS